MARKIFFARDWDKVGKNYYEIFSTVCLGYTFTVGKGIEKDPNFSIFYVTNDGQHDNYELLDIYLTAGDTVERAQKGVLFTLQKEMRKTIKKDLTKKLKSNIITIEQIERIAKNGKEYMEKGNK